MSPNETNIRVVLINGRSVRAPAMLKGLNELSNVKAESLEHDFERSWFRPQVGDVVIFEIAALSDVQDFVRTMKMYSTPGSDFVCIVMNAVKSLKGTDFAKDFSNLHWLQTDPLQAGLDPAITSIVQRHLFFGNTPDESSRRPFKTVRSVEERAKLLRDALHSSALASLAPSGTSHVLNCHLDGADPANGALLFKILPGSEAAYQQLKGLPPVKTVVTLSLKQSRVFFLSPTFRLVGDSLVGVEPPSEFQIVQRRSDFRWPVPPKTFPFRARYEGQQFNSMLIDVSMGGVAVECSAAELPLLKKAVIIRDVEFELEGSLIKIAELELRHSAPLKKDSENYRVGFQIKEISASSRRLLAEFLGSRSLAYFENYLVAKAS